MKNGKFRTPLLQSAAVLGGVIILALIAASSGSGSEGGGIISVLVGIGNAILFIIGLAVSLIISIAILVAIFLAAVGMVAPSQAAEMYSSIKKNFAVKLLAWSTSNNLHSSKLVSEDEYTRMKLEIIDLQNANRSLIEKLRDLEEKNALK